MITGGHWCLHLPDIYSSEDFSEIHLQPVM